MRSGTVANLHLPIAVRALDRPLAIVAKCVFGMIAYRRGKWAVTGLTPRHPVAVQEA